MSSYTYQTTIYNTTIVSEVLPVGVIPRTAEGYRDRVNVLIHLPLVEGTMVNSLSKAITTTPPPPTIDEGPAQPQVVRRRGRPPGSSNKPPKSPLSTKGKAPMVQECCEMGGKKRKVMETDDTIPYNPQPPTLNHDSYTTTSTTLHTEGTSTFSLNFIQQLLRHPQSATLLPNDGIIHPDILNLLNNQQEPPKSPTSIFHGPYSAASDDEYIDNEDQDNNSGMVFTDLSGRLVTVDSSGGIERRTDMYIELGSMNPPKSPLLYSPSTDSHSK
ncbi:hypothetical protein FRX31_005115, partial [Thalictrum thalictroides]